ncbi:MAG: methyltransferase domain-containing protein [Candidatus Methylomirabilales bacterium]
MKTAGQQQKEKVRAAYGEVARTRTPQTDAPCCAPPGHEPDYSRQEIASVPEGAFLSAGSGNPVRAAALQPGEVVVDLGCGAGMDVFLAANEVGRSGRVVGIDMTPPMLQRARINAASSDYTHVEWLQADIERLPLGSGVADVVMSNCVINLAPDKAAVYREIYRVLKPGGRFAVADIVLEGPRALISQAVQAMPVCSCVATALEENAYLEAIRAAGFESIAMVAERPARAQPLNSQVHAQAITLVGRKLSG